MLDFPSLPSLGLISLGLAITSLSLGLGLVNESFALIMTRNVLDLASRVVLTIGMVGSYYPLSTSDKADTDERIRASMALARAPRRPARSVGMTIGGPVAGSFVKMDPNATRSFHHQSLSRGPSQSGSTPKLGRVISRHVSQVRTSSLIGRHHNEDRHCHLPHPRSTSPT